MKLKATFILLISLIWAVFVNAQLPNQVISDKIQINEGDSGRFGFSLINTNYMRNTEYFNMIEEGRTLFGYQLQPKFTYQPGANVKLEAGVWLRHDFGGNNPFTEALPTFSVKLKRNNMQMIFGTLEGALSHGMLEPIMDINSAIAKRIENGFQFKYESKAIWLDTWINWENFIQPNENAKERFTSGVNLKASPIHNDKGSFSFYYQFMASHQGGQIDADTTDPFLMFFNQAFGMSFRRNATQKLSWYFDFNSLFYNESSDSKIYPQKSGIGLMANAGIKYGKTDYMLTYWSGQNFIAPRGTAIYQSISTVDSKHYEPSRQLIFFRIIHNKALFGTPVIASARFEPVYDLNNKIFDYSYSLYLVYRGDWKFGKK